MKKSIVFPCAAIASVLLLAACSKIAAGGDDEAEAEATEQDPPTWPGWIPAAERLRWAPYNVPLPGYESLPQDLEYAAFAPSRLATPSGDVGNWVDVNLADPSPKPWGWGIPDVTGAPPRQNMTESNPFYTWLSFDAILGTLTEAQQEQWFHGALDIPPEVLPAVEFDYALRSGIGGNYGLWVTYSVPSTHPRPPIVWMNLLDLATHSFYAGRYQALGQVCSTARGQTQDLYWGEIVTQASPEDLFYDADAQIAYSGPNADCKRGMHYYGVHAIGNLFPLEPAQTEHYPTESIEAAICLDNGGQYEVYNGDLNESGEFDAFLGNGAVLTAGERNGLVWVNGSELVKLFQVLAANTPPPWDQLFVVIDVLQDEGFNWFSWPVDAEYRHSMWSKTGVCAYAAEVELDAECDWWTTLACPRHMLPVLPEFSRSAMEGACEAANLLGDPFEPQTVGGYCTFPSWLVPPGHAAPIQPPFWGLDIRPVDNGETGLGIPGGFVIGMSDMRARLEREVIEGASESEAILSWVEDIGSELQLVEDLEGGLRLMPQSADARAFMATLQVSIDDRIVSIGHGNDSIEDPNVEQFALYISQAFDADEIGVLTISNDATGTMRFHYLFPVFENLHDLDLVTTDPAPTRN